MGDRDRANVLFVGHWVEGYYMSVVSIGYTAVGNDVYENYGVYERTYRFNSKRERKKEKKC